MNAPGTTYAEVLWARAARDPDGEVLRVPDGERWTAEALRRQAASVAAGLVGHVGPGDVVVTCVDAGPDAVAVTGAVSALGAVELPVAADLPADWACRLVTDAGARAVVASARRAADPMPQLLAVYTGHPAHVVDGSTPLHPGTDRIDPVSLPATAPALIVSTSGTTGRSKTALLPVGAAVGQARRVAAAMHYGPEDVLLGCFPWHHINARNATVLPALMSGARVVMVPRFSATSFLDLVRRERITAFNFMGAMCMMLLAQPTTPHDRDHAIIKAYGGPAPARMVDNFRERFGVTLRQAYACTELGDVATTPMDALRPGAAGRVVADHEVRIVDGEGNVLAEGTSGEILVRPRGEGLALLDYVGDPEAVAQAWSGPWFRTRDRGRLVDGWLHVDGRTGDVIRRRGVNIDPHHVEEALVDHPSVAEVAAVGVPSELTEDEVLAVVVPRAGTRIDPAALWLHCREILPRAAVPRYLSVEASLPHTATHKLDRAALRRRGLPATSWDAGSTRPLPTESQ